MRADHHYEPLEPTGEEKEALEAWPGAQLSFTYESILESRDAPPTVLAYFERRAKHRREWEEGAKDRAFTIEPAPASPSTASAGSLQAGAL